MYVCMYVCMYQFAPVFDGGDRIHKFPDDQTSAVVCFAADLKEFNICTSSRAWLL